MSWRAQAGAWCTTSGCVVPSLSMPGVTQAGALCRALPTGLTERAKRALRVPLPSAQQLPVPDTPWGLPPGAEPLQGHPCSAGTWVPRHPTAGLVSHCAGWLLAPRPSLLAVRLSQPGVAPGHSAAALVVVRLLQNHLLILAAWENGHCSRTLSAEPILLKHRH